MAEAKQTVERRQLGLTLRRLRTELKLSQQVAADTIGKVRSKIVQLEDGTATIDPDALSTLLDLYQVTDEHERATVHDLAAQGRKRARNGPHFDTLPESYERLADLEADAAEINSIEQGIIPALLQSPFYVHALHNESEGVYWKRGAKEGKDRVEFRLHRQRRVWQAANPPLMRYLISEDALRAGMGSPEVMHQQLHHLLALMDEHPALNIRVLTNAMYGNPVRGHGFTVIGFGNRGTAVGVVDGSFIPNAYIDDHKEVQTMLRVFHHVWERSVSRTESEQLIAGIAKEL